MTIPGGFLAGFLNHQQYHGMTENNFWDHFSENSGDFLG